MIPHQLTKENLRSIAELTEQDTVMGRIPAEQGDVPMAIRRISSTSTVKSVYFDSSPSGSSPGSPEDPLENELNLLKSLKPESTVCFNVMVLGDSGLGKTSFIKTYSALKFLDLSSVFSMNSGSVETPTTELTHNKFVRRYGSFQFKMDLIDTPGYAQFRNVKGWLACIRRKLRVSAVNYYKAKKYGKPEDSRIHLALYFIDGVLSPSDLVALKELDKVLSIVLVIAKADLYTGEELQAMKAIVRNVVDNENIQLFDCEAAADMQKGELAESPLGPCPPFALISGITQMQEGSKCFYGRRYTWGFCDINNPKHCDYKLLNAFVIRAFAFYAIQEGKVHGKNLYKEHMQIKDAKAAQGCSRDKTLPLLVAAASLLTLGFFLKR